MQIMSSDYIFLHACQRHTAGKQNQQNGATHNHIRSITAGWSLPNTNMLCTVKHVYSFKLGFYVNTRLIPQDVFFVVAVVVKIEGLFDFSISLLTFKAHEVQSTSAQRKIHLFNVSQNQMKIGIHSDAKMFFFFFLSNKEFQIVGIDSVYKFCNGRYNQIDLIASFFPIIFTTKTGMTFVLPSISRAARES